MRHIEDNILRDNDGSIIAVTFTKMYVFVPSLGGYRSVDIDLYIGDRYESYIVGEFRLIEDESRGPTVEAISTCGYLFGEIYERQRSVPMTLRLEYSGRYTARLKEHLNDPHTKTIIKTQHV